MFHAYELRDEGAVNLQLAEFGFSSENYINLSEEKSYNLCEEIFEMCS